MVEVAAVRDISDASVYQGNGLSLSIPHFDSQKPLQEYAIATLYIKSHTASHARSILTVNHYTFFQYSFSYFAHCPFVLPPVVRVRSREGRQNRAPPPCLRWKDGKKVYPAVAAAEDAKAAEAAAKA
jgi:small subunit ribosomal protein S26e